jgi:serine/threonine protein kinase
MKDGEQFEVEHRRRPQSPHESGQQDRVPMIKLQAGEYLGTYRVQKFLGRGGFAYVYQAEDSQGRKVALKVGDVAGGGRYVTRFVEITDERSQEWISPDETPGEAVFFRPDGVRIDFLDMHEIDMMIRSRASGVFGFRFLGGG